MKTSEKKVETMVMASDKINVSVVRNKGMVNIVAQCISFPRGGIAPPFKTGINST